VKNFVFVHVPKCGGITFIHNVNLIYPGQTFQDFSYKYYRRFGMVKTSELSYLHPEAGFCPEKEYKMIYGHFSAEKWKKLGLPIVSIVRDPVERVISNYCVWKKVGRKGYYRNIKEVWGIRRYAEYNSNFMSGQLGEDLDSFLFIGIQEKYNKSIRKIGGLLGITFPRDIGVHNKTPDRLEIRQEDKDYIESVNQKDRKLYENIVRRFHEN